MNEEALAKEVVGSIGKVDLTPLRQFETWKEDLTSIDLASGALYMRRFIRAYEWCTKLAIDLHKRLEDAIVESEHQEAKAKLERAPAYFEANKDKLGGMKDSSTLRETYLAMDDEYRKSREKVNALRALAKFLDVKAESFRMAHDDAKKIYDKLLGNDPGMRGRMGMPSAEGGIGSVEE
jgi:hypothetical protein